MPRIEFQEATSAFITAHPSNERKEILLAAELGVSSYWLAYLLTYTPLLIFFSSFALVLFSSLNSPLILRSISLNYVNLVGSLNHNQLFSNSIKRNFCRLLQDISEWGKASLLLSLSLSFKSVRVLLVSGILPRLPFQIFMPLFETTF